MLLNHDEQLDKGKIKLIGSISFLIGFAQAVLAYVMSAYFKEALGSENIGLYYSISFGVILVALLNLHKVIRRFGKSDIFFVTMIGKLVVLSFLATTAPSFWGAALLVLYLIFANINWVSLDIILESFSVDHMSGRIRGMHLMILDAGFILGPFLSTQILEQYNFQMVFLFSLIIEFMIILLAVKSLRGVNHRFNGRLTVRGLVKKVFVRKNIMRIYYISFVLEFFYAVMLIYSALYLRDIGISWEQIGFIFTAMLIPFVVLPYPAGFLADKKTGEKEMLLFAVAVMGIFTAAIYFVNSNSLWLWAAVLFATRIGASLIQTLRDSYFYKKIDGHDVDVINFYRTALPVAYIAASAVSFVILQFFPMKVLFLMLAAVVLSALYPAFRLKDNRSEKELLKSC